MRLRLCGAPTRPGLTLAGPVGHLDHDPVGPAPTSRFPMSHYPLSYFPLSCFPLSYFPMSHLR